MIEWAWECVQVGALACTLWHSAALATAIRAMRQSLDSAVEDRVSSHIRGVVDKTRSGLREEISKELNAQAQQTLDGLLKRVEKLEGVSDES